MTHKSIMHCPSNGWLNVKQEPDGKEQSLPEYLKVDHTETKGGRDHFTVLEGRRKGDKFSVISSAQALKPLMTYVGGAVITFLPAKSLLRLSGHIDLQAITWELDPVPEGSHCLMVPDHPHKEQDHPEAGPHRHAWFPIDYAGARYLHPGTASAGCVTVTSLTEWTGLYSNLIRRRADDECLGMLQVCAPDADDWCKLFNGKYQIAVDSAAWAWGLLNLQFSPGGTNCLNVQGATDNGRYSFRGTFALANNTSCGANFGPPGGSVMEGRLVDSYSGSPWPKETDLRVGCHEFNHTFTAGLMVPVQIEFKGTLAEGHWNIGKPHKISLTAIEKRRRPWYNYPWNYPVWNPSPHPA